VTGDPKTPEVPGQREAPVRVTLIAAVARHRVLGRDGGIPWRLPADLKRFQQRTMGHPLVMGRRTWESIGRPLPGRRMVVVTRQVEYLPHDEVSGEVAAKVIVVPSLEAALDRAETVAREMARERAQEAGDARPEIFIAGGGDIYRQALPHADRIDLTEVDLEVAGDTFFPGLDESEWRELSREDHPADERNPHPFRFRVLERRDPAESPGR